MFRYLFRTASEGRRGRDIHARSLRVQRTLRTLYGAAIRFNSVSVFLATKFGRDKLLTRDGRRITLQLGGQVFGRLAIFHPSIRRLIAAFAFPVASMLAEFNRDTNGTGCSLPVMLARS
jgi:hypothetical protein